MLTGWVKQAYPRPTIPKQLQTQALGILTQGQACELDVPSYLGGFGWGLWQRQTNMSTHGLLVPAVEGGGATI